MAILFISVLLHEFGTSSARASWAAGGEEILMWPLGGLGVRRSAAPTLASLVCTACGPLVNILICVITGILLVILSRGTTRSRGSRSARPEELHPDVHAHVLRLLDLHGELRDTAFNLTLLFYPFDGGRIVQELLWFKYGYYKSMMFATAVGMVGAVIVAMVGLGAASLLLILIAAFGFYTCVQQRRMLKEAGPYGFEEEESGLYAAAYEPQTPKRKQPSRWAVRREKKRVAAEHAEQKDIDAILSKVSAQGMNSLTWLEKRRLRQATERQRKADAARTSRRSGDITSGFDVSSDRAYLHP
jgi:Zn-dependent protease